MVLNLAMRQFFKGSNFILVPTQKNKKETIEAVKELANKMEFGRICTLSIEEHDKMIGFFITVNPCHCSIFNEYTR